MDIEIGKILLSGVCVKGSRRRWKEDGSRSLVPTWVLSHTKIHSFFPSRWVSGFQESIEVTRFWPQSRQSASDIFDSPSFTRSLPFSLTPLLIHSYTRLFTRSHLLLTGPPTVLLRLTGTLALTLLFTKSYIDCLKVPTVSYLTHSCIHTLIHPSYTHSLNVDLHSFFLSLILSCMHSLTHLSWTYSRYAVPRS